MTDEPEPSHNLEERLQSVVENVRLITEVARPSLADSLRAAREALRGLDAAVAGGLRRLEEAKRVGGLYVIVDPAFCKGRDPRVTAEQALDGGAGVIQWRDKLRDKGDQLSDVRAIGELCERYAALLIVNDHLDLALAGRAHGVHVGQHDLPVAEVRRLSPAAFIVGCSTNNPDEARRAQAAGADYVAVGRVFPSTTKGDTRDASPETVRVVKEAVSIPVVAIGGITAGNVEQVIAAGADAAAVITAVCEAEDVEAAALALSRQFERAAERNSR